jgi:hypothetical protein
VRRSGAVSVLPLLLSLLVSCGSPEPGPDFNDVMVDYGFIIPPPVLTQDDPYVPQDPYPARMPEIPLPKKDEPWRALVPRPEPEPPPCPICARNVRQGESR